MYETFWTVQGLVDPSFNSMLSVGRLWMEVTHRLVNELVLPLNPLHTVQMLTTMVQRVETSYMHGNISSKFSDKEKIQRLKDAIRRLEISTRVLLLEAQVRNLENGSTVLPTIEP